VTLNRRRGWGCSLQVWAGDIVTDLEPEVRRPQSTQNNKGQFLQKLHPRLLKLMQFYYLHR